MASVVAGPAQRADVGKYILYCIARVHRTLHKFSQVFMKNVFYRESLPRFLMLGLFTTVVTIQLLLGPRTILNFFYFLAEL